MRRVFSFHSIQPMFLFIFGLKENIEKVIIEKGNDDEEEMNENKLK